MKDKIIIVLSIIVIFFGITIISFKLNQYSDIGSEIKFINQEEYRAQSLEEEYRIQIAYWCKIYGADLNKALAIVRAESNFKNVCNYRDCQYGQGIFMFIPGTWKGTGIKMKQVSGDPMDPFLNIQRGVYLLATEGDYHWNMSISSWIKYLK
jgi:soluble lytic murein transglycosylase-like protein